MSARRLGRVILVLVVLVAGAAARPASACSCVSRESPCALLARSDTAVFRGTVLEITKEREDEHGLPARRVRFSLDEPFSELAGRTIEVSSLGGSCEYPFEVGRAYLVYAGRTPSGLSTSACTRTSTLDSATQEIDLLRASKRGAVDPVLHGVVLLWMTRMNGSDLPAPFTGLPAVKVVARGGGTAHETVTGADGVFRLVGLPPGQYRVVAQPGLPFKPLFAADGGKTVTLDRCLGEATFHFIARAFQGQVLRTNGAPAANARVTIVDADKPTPERTVRTTTDAEGRWKVDGLGDGRYRVSVSLPSIGGQPESRTWYPGVSNEAQAQVLVLRERPLQVDLTVP